MCGPSVPASVSSRLAFYCLLQHLVESLLAVVAVSWLEVVMPVAVSRLAEVVLEVADCPCVPAVMLNRGSNRGFSICACRWRSWR